jgi:AcrR family transcriptional regulator
MARKTPTDQALARRQPRQERAVGKVELILEAAARILDRDGLAALTTNRVAEVAGVSIGTLYQYFRDKDAILDTLAQRELERVAQQVMVSLTGAPPDVPGGRIRAVIQAVLGAFGGRTRVNKLLLERALANGTRRPPMGEMHAAVLDLLVSTGVVAHDRRARTIAPAQAYVITHAFSGVMRGLLVAPPAAIERAQIEDALVQLVRRFVESANEAR